jgi:hypothetical protein
MVMRIRIAFDEDRPESQTACPNLPPRQFVRACRQKGFSEREAAALLAYCSGIPLFSGEHPLMPWRLSEIERLLFLRATADRWR